MGFKSLKLNMSMQSVSRIPCRYFEWLARLSIFTHANILVLVNEFVVVIILSEYGARY